MRFRFDRPMRPGSWSITGGGEDFPEIAGKLAFDREGTLLIVPVKLRPGHTYRFGLNSATHKGFVSAEGVPLAPVRVSFRTVEG